MSRSGYTDELDASAIALYRATVNRAIWGKRGQAFLRELLTALDALPEKQLTVHDIQDETGAVCAIGSVAVARRLDVGKLDPYDHKELGETFDIARTLVAEIEFMNDEWPCAPETPAQRWQRMRDWTVSQILPMSVPAPQEPTT